MFAPVFLGKLQYIQYRRGGFHLVCFVNRFITLHGKIEVLHSTLLFFNVSEMICDGVAVKRQSFVGQNFGKVVCQRFEEKLKVFMLLENIIKTTTW